MDEFYNHFSKEYLPTELGGTGPSYNGETVAETLFGCVSRNSFIQRFKIAESVLFVTIIIFQNIPEEELTAF